MSSIQSPLYFITLLQPKLLRLRKFFIYLPKLIYYKNFYEIAQFIFHIKSKHRLSALAAYLDQRPIAIACKDLIGLQDLNFFLKICVHCKHRIYRNFYLWEYQGAFYYATFEQFIGLYHEYLANAFTEIYATNWQNKKVLDIGGYVGDSALYFLSEQAKQVIIYEPVAENVFALQLNLALYAKQIVIYQKAIAPTDGSICLHSTMPTGSLGFGMEEGSFTVECEAISFTTILKTHHVDIAKIDCEGAEKYLLEIEAALLHSIPYWIIETHSLDLKQQMENKFAQAGFDKVKEFTCASSVHVLHFCV